MVASALTNLADLIEAIRCQFCHDAENGPWMRCPGCGLVLCEECHALDLATQLGLCEPEPDPQPAPVLATVAPDGAYVVPLDAGGAVEVWTDDAGVYQLARNRADAAIEVAMSPAEAEGVAVSLIRAAGEAKTDGD